jgi:hypothetical protein
VALTILMGTGRKSLLQMKLTDALRLLVPIAGKKAGR